MTKENQIKILENRLDMIARRPDAFKTPGVMQKLRRKIYKLKKNMNED